MENLNEIKEALKDMFRATIKNAKDGDDENGRWVTIKGTHVFIPDGKKVEDVMREKGWEEKGEGKEKSETKKESNTTKDTKRHIDRIEKLIKKYNLEPHEEDELLDELGSFEAKFDENLEPREEEELREQLFDFEDDIKRHQEMKKQEKSDGNNENKHGFKKDKDSGYYMKDLSDGTSVYVEKKEGGQGEKEPFYLEATHFDKDGKEIAKKQYHYDSMDGMFSKIDRDFSSKDKPNTEKKDKNDEDNIALKYYKQQVSKKLRKLETPEEQQKYIDDLEKKLEDHSDDPNFVEVVKWAKETKKPQFDAEQKGKGEGKKTKPTKWEDRKDRKSIEKKLENIALKRFDTIKTLETQHSDSKDFHDLSVWGIKDVLSEAYQEGAGNKNNVPEKILTDIAKQEMDIPTLKERNSDSYDFHDVSVWSLREALKKAFLAGEKTKADNSIKNGLSEIIENCKPETDQDIRILKGLADILEQEEE